MRTADAGRPRYDRVPMSQLLSPDRQDAFDQHGFVVAESIIDQSRVESLRDRFERLFRGEFETGITPDEVNWQHGASDPSLTRQICNGWRADREVARAVLDASIGEAIAALASWPGTRVIQDNVLWKPMGARSVGYHRDNQYLAWYAPREMYTCWIALDDTTEAGGGLLNSLAGHISGRRKTVHSPRFTLLRTTELWSMQLRPNTARKWTLPTSRCLLVLVPSITDGPGMAQGQTTRSEIGERSSSIAQASKQRLIGPGCSSEPDRSIPATPT